MAAAFIVSGFFAVNANAVISSVDVIYPTASGIYVKGTFNITWTATGEPNDLVDIYYSTNNFGISTKLTASGVAYDAGTYAWNTISPVIPDGSNYKIKVKSTANDINGISENSFTIDNTLPTTPTVLTPNGGEVLKGGDVYNVTWTVSTDVNFSATPIKIEYSELGDFTDTDTVVTATENDGSFDWTLPADDTTTAKIRVTATDLAGNTSSDISNATFTIDSTPPTIPTVSLTGTTVQAGNDTISIIFSEPVVVVDGTWSSNEFTAIESPDGTPLNLTGAVFSYLGNTLTITLNEANEYLHNGDFVAVTPAANKIKDPAGNFMATAEVVGTTAVTGDVAAPTVALTYNPDRPVKDADTIIITATFSNETLLGTPQIAITTVGDGDVTTTAMTVTGDPLIWTYSWDVPSGADDDGTATITISGVTDLAGNANAIATNNTRTVDNTAPAITGYTLNGVAANAFFDPNDPASVVIDITADEPVKFNFIYICTQADGTCNGTTRIKEFSSLISFATTVQKTWDGRKSSDNTIADDAVHKLKVKIVDEAGNETISELSPHLITIDTVNPTIAAFNAPVADVVYKTNTPLQFTPDDSATAVTCAYKIDSGSYIPVVCTAATPVNTTIPDISFSDGRRAVTIKVTDAAGNNVVSSPVSFVFDNNNTLTVGPIVGPAPLADFNTISEAITKSTASDTINVAAGSYSNGLTVNKALTINGGVGGGTSTQTAAVSVTANNVTVNNFTFTGNLGSDAFINLDNDTAHSGITISNNTFSGAITTWHLIRVGGSKTNINITGNTFTGSTSGNDNALIYLGMAGDNINVSNNVFDTFPSTYSIFVIQHNGGGVTRTTDLTINSNDIDFTGYTNGDGAEGISVRYADNVQVNNNTLTGSATATVYEAGITLASVISTVESTVNNNIVGGFSQNIRILRWSAGEGFTDGVNIIGNTLTNGVLTGGGVSRGTGLYLAGTNLLIQNNEFSSNANQGIYIPLTDPAGANNITGTLVSNNKIFSNLSFGVRNLLASVLNASPNWWGAISGPYHSPENTAGTGNAVTDNVDYSPWCTNIGCTTFGSSGPLDHFNVVPSAGSAVVNVPITLTVTAKDVADITRVNDTSVVSMAADHGASLGTLLLTLANGINDTTVVNSLTGTVNVSGIKVGGTATGSTSVLFTNSDVSSPIIISHTPADNVANVAVTVTPYIVFSEPLKASTVNSSNIQLVKFSDDSIVPAVVSLVEGGTRVNIDPDSSLENNTQYYFAVSTGVQDEVGNALDGGDVLDDTTRDDNEFTTVAIQPIVVDEIVVQSNTAQATNLYLDGWHYTFRITVNTPETDLQVKFEDWVNSSNSLQTVAANGNMRLLFNSSTGNGLGSIVGLTDADIVAGVGPIHSFTLGNAYGDQTPGPVDISGLDISTDPGRQIKFDVFTRLPVTTAPGFYETTYTIQTL